MVNQLLQMDDMTYVRAEAKKSLPDTVHVQRRVLESDKQGGYSESWAIVYSNVPARLSFASGNESFAVGREDVEVQVMLTVAHDQSIESSDRIQFGNDTLEVVSVNEPTSWNTAKRCQLRRV
jgi:SPP1 family predicted phage head-tail adaptor